MDYYVLVLRVLHIVAGVFWAGAGWAVAGIFTPAIQATGPAGQQVMGYAVGQRRLSTIFSLAATVNTLTGLLLYWRASVGLNPNWIRTGPGLTLTMGGLAGLTAFLIGFLVNRPLSNRLGAVGRRLAAAQGPPDQGLITEAGQLQARLESAGVWTSILLAVSVILMAGAEQVF